MSRLDLLTSTTDSNALDHMLTQQQERILYDRT